MFQLLPSSHEISTCDIDHLLIQYGWNCYIPKFASCVLLNIPFETQTLETLHENTPSKHLPATWTRAWNTWSKQSSVYYHEDILQRKFCHFFLDPGALVLTSYTPSVVRIQLQAACVEEDQHRKHEKGVQRVRSACFSATQQLHFRAKLLLWARQSRFEPKWGQNGLDLPILARSNISEQGSGGSRFPESALSASLSLYSQSGRQNILHLHRLYTFWQWLIRLMRASWSAWQLSQFSSMQCNAERSQEPCKMCFVQHAS